VVRGGRNVPDERRSASKQRFRGKTRPSFSQYGSSGDAPCRPGNNFRRLWSVLDLRNGCSVLTEGGEAGMRLGKVTSSTPQFAGNALQGPWAGTTFRPSAVSAPSYRPQKARALFACNKMREISCFKWVGRLCSFAEAHASCRTYKIKCINWARAGARHVCLAEALSYL